MTLTPRSQSIPGRLYSSDDLHVAGLICIDRREVVRKELLRTFRHLDSVDVMAIQRSVELLLTCNERMFSQIEQEVQQ